VLEQGELLNVISKNADDALGHIVSARIINQRTRKEMEKDAGKRKMLLLCICILFVIVLASVLGSTIPTLS
jgi:t-SNARE complex subunit (syntaxin)